MNRKFNILMPVFGGAFGAAGHFLGALVLNQEWPRFLEAALYIGIAGLLIIGGCVLAECVSPLVNGYNWRRNYLTVTLKYLILAALPAFAAAAVMQGLYQLDFTPRVRRDIYMLIDISGSMEWNDPGDERLRAVERLAETFGADERLEIIAFDHQAEVVLPLTPMGGDESLDAVRQAVSGMAPRGGTEFNAVLGLAFERISEFTTGDPAGNRKPIVILLSDGESEMNSEVLQSFADSEIPINTIGLLLSVNFSMQDGEVMLERIARETGGGFVNVSDTELLDLAFSEVYRPGERFILHGEPGFDILRCLLYVIAGGLTGFMTAFIFDNKPVTVPFAMGGAVGGLIACALLLLPFGLLPSAAALGFVFPFFSLFAKS